MPLGSNVVFAAMSALPTFDPAVDAGHAAA